MIAPESLTIAEVQQALAALPSGPCWGGRLYLGSMFFLDFGQRLLHRRARGSVHMGSTSFSVRDAYWELKQGGKQVTDAEAVSPESFESEILPKFINQSIVSIEAAPSGSSLRFGFTGDLVLEVDVSGKWPVEHAAELGLSDGRYILVDEQGRFICSTERNPTRMQASAPIGSR